MRLSGRKIALFVANLYEDMEFWYPYYRMTEEGAEVVSAVKTDEFNALIIPGGYSPDHVRRVPEMVQFVKDMHAEGKPVAAICHAGWMLASAGILEANETQTFLSRGN